MQRLNRDTIIALLLLCAVGFLLNASFGIKTPEFDRLAPGQMDPGFWPQIILSGLGLMGVIYLIQSIIDPPEPGEKRGGLAGWYRHYKNPIWCFVAFGLFLTLIPIVGMLIAGLAFVFGLMSFLGPKSRTAVSHHATATAATVGGMWFVFACLLEVQLPRGELTGGMDEWLVVNLCGLVADLGELVGASIGSCTASAGLA